MTFVNKINQLLVQVSVTLKTKWQLVVHSKALHTMILIIHGLRPTCAGLHTNKPFLHLAMPTCSFYF
jgi:hypothetical protein